MMVSGTGKKARERRDEAVKQTTPTSAACLRALAPFSTWSLLFTVLSTHYYIPPRPPPWPACLCLCLCLHLLHHHHHHPLLPPLYRSLDWSQ